MCARVKDGTCLAALVRMAKPLCRAAEHQCPRTGPGRPPAFPDWLMAMLIMIAVLKKRKSKSAQYRFLWEHRQELQRWLDWHGFPARSTYFDRYQRAHQLFEVAIRLQGQQALKEGVADAQTVAVDKSLWKALGPQWHAKDRRAGRIPPKLRGVDRGSTWGYSEHDHAWKSDENLIRNLIDIASKGGNYLLNVGPMPDGTFPAESIERLQFIKQWMGQNAQAIYGTTYAAPIDKFSGKVTRKGDCYYLHVFDWPATGVLEIGEFPGSVVGVSLLSSEVLPFRQNAGRLEIQLPIQAPDPTVSVLAVETKNKG